MAWASSGRAFADTADRSPQAGQPVVNTIGLYVADFGGGSGWQRVYNAAVMPGGLTPSEQELVLVGEEVKEKARCGLEAGIGEKREVESENSQLIDWE